VKESNLFAVVSRIGFYDLFILWGAAWLQDGSLKFNKMSDEDKKRFIEAVTGSGGKIDSKVTFY
jgi:hypothetical protein